MQIIEILSNSKLEDNKLYLPDIKLERNTYLEVAKKLELIGGKWNRKGYFLFNDNPQSLLNELCNGSKVNLKKDYQAFFTPENIADIVIEYAELSEHDKVLEPSAGQGSLIKSLNKLNLNIKVDCYELMDLNRKYLQERVCNINLIGNDFLKADENTKYNKIIANPPFNKMQYIEHTYKMYNVLENNGIMVVILPTSWKHNSSKKEVSFKNWLEEKANIIETLDKGSFKESGTNIETCIVKIIK